MLAILPHKVQVQALTTTQDAAAADVEAYAAVAGATCVPCLIEVGGASRGRLGQAANVQSGTVFGLSPHLGREDSRLLVVAGPLKGKYLRVESVREGGGVGTICRHWTLAFSEWGALDSQGR